MDGSDRSIMLDRQADWLIDIRTVHRRRRLHNGGGTGGGHHREQRQWQQHPPLGAGPVARAAAAGGATGCSWRRRGRTSWGTASRRRSAWGRARKCSGWLCVVVEWGGGDDCVWGDAVFAHNSNPMDGLIDANAQAGGVLEGRGEHQAGAAGVLHRARRWVCRCAVLDLCVYVLVGMSSS